MSPRLSRGPTTALTRVFLDTSAIFTDSIKAPLRRDLAEFVRASRTAQPRLKWCIPEVVLHERTAQMLDLAIQKLPAVESLEALVGHSIGVREEITRDRIRERVEAEFLRIGVEVLPLDPAAIDLRDLMLSAAYRQPPFSPGPGEKGFRDALILASIRHASRPVEAGERSLFLVNDSLLATTAETVATLTVLRSFKALKDYLDLPAPQPTTDVSSEYQRFQKLLGDSAFHLTEGTRYAGLIAGAIADHGVQIRRFTSALRSQVAPSPEAAKISARNLVSSVNELSRRTARIIQDARPQYERHSLEALSLTARAATTPLVFDETERPELEENISGLEMLLTSLDETQPAIVALQEGVQGAEAAMATAGADSRPLLDALHELILTGERLGRTGRAAMDAFRALLANGSEAV